jgi:hypothetical protein
MGYHISLAHAQFPESLKRGAPAIFKFEWKNDGVAPIYVPCALALALLEQHDKPAETAWPNGSSPARWASDKTTSESFRCTFSQAPPGKYRLVVGLVSDSKSATPLIRLANADRVAGGWYVLGRIDLR